MNNKKAHKRTKTALKSTMLPPISVTPMAAFHALSISRDLGYRLIRQRVIPTVRLGKRLLVPVDELRKMLAAMVEVDRTCRTCARKDPKGKCAAFASPPKDVAHCPAWTFDENWNLKVWRDTIQYEGRKKK